MNTYYHLIKISPKHGTLYYAGIKAKPWRKWEYNISNTIVKYKEIDDVIQAYEELKEDGYVFKILKVEVEENIVCEDIEHYTHEDPSKQMLFSVLKIFENPITITLANEKLESIKVPDNVDTDMLMVYVQSKYLKALNIPDSYSPEMTLDNVTWTLNFPGREILSTFQKTGEILNQCQKE